MTLKEYLEKNKISIENAAKDLGFSYEDSRYFHGCGYFCQRFFS